MGSRKRRQPVAQQRPSAVTAGVEQLLTPADVAFVLQCSIKTAQRLMASRSPIWLGRMVRWQQHTLADFLAAGGVAVIRGQK